MAEAGFADGVPGTFEVILPPWGNLIKMLENLSGQSERDRHKYRDSAH